VAEAGGLPVGCVSVNEDDAVPGLLHLFALDVAPSFQRRGVGTALIRRIESEAEQRPFEGIWLDVEITNEDARRLYERLGFQREEGIVVNRYTSLTSGESVEETCYRMFKRSRGSRRRLELDS
jgi:ribosomal protein S18 acetylase RimI-like enzyme